MKVQINLPKNIVYKGKGGIQTLDVKSMQLIRRDSETILCVMLYDSTNVYKFEYITIEKNGNVVVSDEDVIAMIEDTKHPNNVTNLVNYGNPIPYYSNKMKNKCKEYVELHEYF